MLSGARSVNLLLAAFYRVCKSPSYLWLKNELIKVLYTHTHTHRYNEPIMKPEHHQNQDTNDRFMANIQRNGTFSVVPRIAAGEITPEGLIAIGQVAKKYKLYTKVW